jgi:hypothetical protein
MNCPYCDGHGVLTDSKKVYGVSYGMIYLCSNYPRCDAYVGAHKSGGQPKGTMARWQLRKLRIEAHFLFDPLWMNKKMKRNRAYALMGSLLDIPRSECHIGMMNEERCKVFIQKMKEYYASKKPTDH